VTGKASVAAETDVTLGSVVSSLVLLGHSSDVVATGLATIGLATIGLATTRLATTRLAGND
jgi:hypothetical protein